MLTNLPASLQRWADLHAALEKGVITFVPNIKGSKVSTPTKAKGGIHPILNFPVSDNLNKFLFQVEIFLYRINTVCNWLPSPGRLFGIFENKRCLLTPSLPDGATMLSMFCCGHQLFALPFGLFAVPWVFTKVLASVLTLFHFQSIPTVDLQSPDADQLA